MMKYIGRYPDMCSVDVGFEAGTEKLQVYRSVILILKFP
jgi:hypothetical protein